MYFTPSQNRAKHGFIKVLVKLFQKLAGDWGQSPMVLSLPY